MTINPKSTEGKGVMPSNAKTQPLAFLRGDDVIHAEQQPIVIIVREADPQ